MVINRNAFFNYIFNKYFTIVLGFSGIVRYWPISWRPKFMIWRPNFSPKSPAGSWVKKLISSPVHRSLPLKGKLPTGTCSISFLTRHDSHLKRQDLYLGSWGSHLKRIILIIYYYRQIILQETKTCASQMNDSCHRFSLSVHNTV